MPASNIDVYNMQDARNNFGAVRPVPICADANEFMGQCHNRIHISTNLYYGFHGPNSLETTNEPVNTDYEMETSNGDVAMRAPINIRKRCADDVDHPQTKRVRQEVQKEKTIEPETSEKNISNIEDLLETLYWHIHGGSVCDLLQLQ